MTRRVVLLGLGELGGTFMAWQVLQETAQYVMAGLDRKRHVAVQQLGHSLGNLRPPQSLHSPEGVRVIPRAVVIVGFSFPGADRISRPC